MARSMMARDRFSGHGGARGQSMRHGGGIRRPAEPAPPGDSAETALSGVITSSRVARCRTRRGRPAGCARRRRTRVLAEGLRVGPVASASPSPRRRSALARASASSTVRSRSASARIRGRRLGALGAGLGGDALPLGLHAAQDRLRVLLRQVGAADAHVLDRTTPKPGISLVHLVADVGHDPLAVGRQHVEQLCCCPARGAGWTRRSNSAGRGCRPPPCRPPGSSAAGR